MKPSLNSAVRSLGLFAAASFAVACMATVSGCASVAPYERGALAHPTMSPEDMSTGFDGHVREVSEGATGGVGGGGGGCGCN
jgi:hypothetical protein